MRPWGLWGLGLAVAAAILAIAYFRPSPNDEPAADPSDAAPVILREATITLPAQPAERTVEQLREEAERAAIDLLQKYPQSAGALHIVAMHYAGLNQHQKAAELWEQSMALEPGYAGPRVGLAKAAMERGDDAAAIRILEEALAAGARTPQVYLELVSALQKTGGLKPAAQRAQQGLDAFPGETGLWVALGQIQLQQEAWESAAAVLAKAVELEPNSATAHFGLAAAYERIGQNDLAAEHRRRFEELQAEHPLERNRFHVVYEAALRSQVVSTLCNAAAEHQQQGQLAETERLYFRALELNPNNPDTCRWLASLYHRQGRIGDAQLVQQRLVKLEPKRVDNYLNLASIAAKLGQTGAAEDALLVARREVPGAPIVHQSLAGLYLEQGRNAEARASAEEAVRLSPSAEAYMLLVAACERLGDTAGAQLAMNTARRLSDHPHATPPLP